MLPDFHFSMVMGRLLLWASRQARNSVLECVPFTKTIYNPFFVEFPDQLVILAGFFLGGKGGGEWTELDQLVDSMTRLSNQIQILGTGGKGARPQIRSYLRMLVTLARLLPLQRWLVALQPAHLIYFSLSLAQSLPENRMPKASQAYAIQHCIPKARPVSSLSECLPASLYPAQLLQSSVSRTLRFPKQRVPKVEVPSRWRKSVHVGAQCEAEPPTERTLCCLGVQRCYSCLCYCSQTPELLLQMSVEVMGLFSQFTLRIPRDSETENCLVN